jgi:hypothetical protein
MMMIPPSVVPDWAVAAPTDPIALTTVHADAPAVVMRKASPVCTNLPMSPTLPYAPSLVVTARFVSAEVAEADSAVFFGR